MEQSEDNKIVFKERLISFFNRNKIKIYFLIGLLLLIISSIYLIKFKNEKENIFIAEQYVLAGLYLSSKENEKAKVIYEEILQSKNKFYSILALNSIIEKKLITDKKKILDYFKLLEGIKYPRDKTDLIILKKALFLIKNNDSKSGNILLQKLIDQNSSLKKIALDIISE